MSEEIAVLKGLLSKDRYLRYSPVLSKINELEPEIKSILKSIEKYYKKYPENKSLTLDELKMFYQYQFPDAKDKDIVNETFQRLKEVEVANEELLKDMVDLVIERHIVGKMVAKGMLLLNGDSGTVIEEIKDCIEEYDRISQAVGQSEVEFCNLTLEEMIEKRNRGGLNFRLQSLRDSIGPIVPGSLMHVFARKETGKTAFAISEATHFASQIKGTDKVILYLGNEEPIYRTKMRAMCAMFDVTNMYLMNHQEEMWELWKQHGEPYIKFADGVTRVEIVERYLMNTNPACVFIDQGPKVMVRGDHPRHQALQIAYYDFRQFTTKYDTPIIAMGQADGASEGKLWLSLTNIDGAKTGMPGELDIAVGIGKEIGNPAKENVRYINVCANKLGGMPASKQAFLTPSGRYKDVGAS